MTATGQVGQVGEYSVGSLVRIRERDWVVLPAEWLKVVNSNCRDERIGYRVTACLARSLEVVLR